MFLIFVGGIYAVGAFITLVLNLWLVHNGNHETFFDKPGSCFTVALWPAVWLFYIVAFVLMAPFYAAAAIARKLAGQTKDK